MRRFHVSRIVLQLSGQKQAVILIVTSRKEEHHGPVSRAVDRGRATLVNEERCCHPNLRIREKILVLSLLHTGLTRQHAAKAVGVSRATVQRYVAWFRQGGLDGLRQWNLSRPVSEMAAYRELIRASFEKQPATTIAEACERIFQLTGFRRGLARPRKFLKDLGLKFYRGRAIPVPPKNTWPSTLQTKPLFSRPN